MARILHKGLDRCSAERLRIDNTVYLLEDIKKVVAQRSFTTITFATVGNFHVAFIFTLYLVVTLEAIAI